MHSHSHDCNRRKFLGELATAALACGVLGSIPAALAVEPFKRQGAPRLALSLAAYSFRESFKTNAAHHIDLFDFVDFALITVARERN